MSKLKEKKATNTKLASKKDIKFACEMIYRDFGFLRSMSFKLSHDTVAHILRKKSNRLEQDDYYNFLEEMLSHQYFVTVTEKYFIFLHMSLAESLGEIDSDVIKCFEFCKEK